jgi:hypothetical protein
VRHLLPDLLSPRSTLLHQRRHHHQRWYLIRPETFGRQHGAENWITSAESPAKTLAAYLSSAILDAGEPPLPFSPNTLWSPGGAGLLVQASSVLLGSLILALVALTDDER